MENENIKDLGQWKVPTKWSEVTLKQFQDIQRLYSDKETSFDVRDVLHILTNHSKEEVNELPIEFTEKILSIVTFLQDEPTIGEPTNTIEIKGTKYIVNTQSKLKTGEYVAVDNVMRQDKNNFALFLAIMCRKQDEEYDLKFENEMVEERMHMFEEIPMLDAMRVINFFLTSYLASGTHSLLSSQIMDAISLTRKDIETSVQNGTLTKRSMRSLEKKLKRLEEDTIRISTTI